MATLRALLQSQGGDDDAAATAAPATPTEVVPPEPEADVNDAVSVIGSGEAAGPLVEYSGIRSDDPKCARRALWSVGNLASLRGQASRCGQTVSCSDAFALDGYMVRLELELSSVDGVVFLRPCFRLCRGPNDAALEWPFKKKFSVRLARFQRKGVSVRFELDTAEMTDCREFWMPAKERNSPFAMCELTLHTAGLHGDRGDGAGALHVYLEL